MIGLEDRLALTRDIHVAHAAGARLKPACAMAGIDLRTLQRWQATAGLVGGDRLATHLGRYVQQPARPQHRAGVPRLPVLVAS
mgnify:CR=1 FL=1